MTKFAFLARNFLLSAAITVASTYTFAAPFVCDGRLYQVADIGNPSGEQSLLLLDPKTSSYIEVATVDGVTLNAVGYRQQDGFAYGISDAAGIVRLHSDGTVDILGGTGITTTIAGDVGPDGYLYSYRSASRQLQVIDVTPSPPVVIENITLTSSQIPSNLVTDFAFSSSGQVHMSLNNGGYLVGEITGVNNPLVPTSATFTQVALVPTTGIFGAQWVDGNNVHYLGHNETGDVYRYSEAAGAFELLLSTNLIASTNDGFSCRQFTPFGAPTPVPALPYWLLTLLIIIIFGCTSRINSIIEFK